MPPKKSQSSKKAIKDSSADIAANAEINTTANILPNVAVNIAVNVASAVAVNTSTILTNVNNVPNVHNINNVNNEHIKATSMCSKRIMYMNILYDILKNNADINKVRLITPENNVNNLSDFEYTLRALARRIERSCLNYVVGYCESEYIERFWNEPKFVNRYTAELYKHISNLDSSLDTYSRDYFISVITGSIDIKTIGGLSSSEINPDASLDERNFINAKLAQKIKHRYTNKFPCVKCQSTNVTYQVVSRSLGADEITKIGYKCSDCSHYWVRG